MNANLKLTLAQKPQQSSMTQSKYQTLHAENKYGGKIELNMKNLQEMLLRNGIKLSGPFDIIDGKIIKDSKRISLNEVQSLTFHKHAKAWLTSYFIVLLGVGLVGLGLGLVLESDGLLTVGGLGIMLYATIWIYLGNLLSTRLVEHLDCSKWKFSAQ